MEPLRGVTKFIYLGDGRPLRSTDVNRPANSEGEELALGHLLEAKTNSL